MLPQFTRWSASSYFPGGTSTSAPESSSGAARVVPLSMRSFPVGIAYALWSGLGIVFIAIIGLVVFGQRLDWPAIIGIGLILAGIVVINLFSATTGH
ncbi:MAG: QacE family quaternary ammonium compound efflux SMR transporter [bacterium]|nr:QacE family quaternary ammonium compound efflux SMR transporter [bacterium]